MIKLQLAIIFTLWVSFNCFGQKANWQWSRSGTGGDVEGWAVAADNAGNAIITGYFDGTLTLGNDTFVNNLHNGAYFIAKYDANGNYLWGKGGPDNRIGSSSLAVCTDANNNIIMAGYYWGDSIVFGSTILHNSNPALTKIYTVKYDASGNLLWARQSATGNGGSPSTGLVTDKNGDVYLAGFFLDSLTFAGTRLVSYGTTNAMLLKYDANGNEVWGMCASINLSVIRPACVAQALAIDPAGNVAITGWFTGDSIKFGNNPAIYLNRVLPGQYSTNLYTAKFNSSGNLIWGKTGNMSSGLHIPFGLGNGIAEDQQGNTYITGEFSSDSITFDQFTKLNTTPGENQGDFFLVKYNAAGNALWAKSGGGDTSVTGFSLATDDNENIYLSGGYYADFSIDSTSFLTPAPAVGNQDPMFICIMDSNGNMLDAESLCSGGDDQNAICPDHHGNVFVCGDYRTRLFPVGNDTFELIGEEVVFISKFNCPGIATGIQKISGKQEINIYPNPTTGWLTVETTMLQPISINIYDAKGNTVYTLPFNAEIDLNNLSKGTYIIEITGKQNKARKQFVKM